jgi:peroxiredoxin
MLKLTNFLLVLTVFSASVANAEKTKPVKSHIGRVISNFSLKDYRGKQHTLADFKKNKLVVVVFLGTECPLVKLYAPKLAKLHAEYQPKGVAFVGINANSHDSITEIAAYARIHKINFPILKDLGNKVADQMGAIRTPEVFVLDEKRKIRYWGRIDDQYGVGVIRDQVKREDLRIAINELLTGKPVSRPTIPADGCHIGRVLTPNPNSPVTYTKHIAPLLQKRCVECHRKGDIAPFALTKYEEVAGWAETIEEVVFDQRMPPWHADPKHGKFTNDRSLSKQEKELIQTWVRNGAPRGKGKPTTIKSTFVSGWQMPQKPDEIFEMRKIPFTVPAEGEFTKTGVRRGVRYKHFVVDPGFKEDKWIRMAQALPGNRAVVHHILVAVRPPGGRRKAGIGGGEFLVAYVPGLRARVYPKGYAKFVPAGSKLIFQLHYTPIGSEQLDLSKLGLVYADSKDVKQVVYTTRAANHRFRIPPRDNNHRVYAETPDLPYDVQLLSLMPHMHIRGKSFQYTARFPNGDTKVMLNVPRYDFNWQTQYHLAKPIKFPKGTQMQCTAHFDNSKENLANPNPNRTVGWGDQTWDEMMIGYFDVVVPAPKFRAYLKRMKK